MPKTNLLVGVLATGLCVSLPASAGESTHSAGADLSYTYNENIRLTADNIISLQGFIASGFWKTGYKTERLDANIDLDVEFERYSNSTFKTDDPFLIAPEADAFNSDNQDLKGDVAYRWERHTLSVSGRYWRDSTLNTEFTDTGDSLTVGDVTSFTRQIEGASRRVEATLRPVWNWQISERQWLRTSIDVQNTNYESERFSDYHFRRLGVNWSYMFSENFYFQLEPYYASFTQLKGSLIYPDSRTTSQRNVPIFGFLIPVEQEQTVALAGQPTNIAQDTVGFKAGFKWAIAENLQWDFLGGAARVRSRFDEEALVGQSLAGSLLYPLPDGLVLAVRKYNLEYENTRDNPTSTTFVGNTNLSYSRERWGLNATLDSNVQPSGDGILRTVTQAGITAYIELTEHQQIKFNTLLGYNQSSDDRIDDGRLYREFGVEYNYRFLQDWYVGANYRYREQKLKEVDKGKGNRLLLTLTYRFR